MTIVFFKKLMLEYELIPRGKFKTNDCGPGGP